MVNTLKTNTPGFFASRRGWLVCGAVLATALVAAAVLFAKEKKDGIGIARNSKRNSTNVDKPLQVEVIEPTPRDIVRVVGQPSFVEAYERTSIYPKVTGYIEKWTADIGDQVKKGEVLAVIYVPEMRELWETKKATVELDQEKVELARKIVKVAEANVIAAESRVTEVKEILNKYKAEMDRWGTEVKRLKKEVDKGVVAPQVLLESENQLLSSTAAWHAGQATVQKSEAELLSMQATKDQDDIAVRVAQVDVKVAISEAKRLEAWVSYLNLIAPYDGIVTARNANTLDFVAPKVGDPSADQNAPDLSPSGSAAPIYVVDRIDVVRIFMDVPERDAKFVTKGTLASVYIQAFRDHPIPAQVTRTSWALNPKSRTLRAEIDLQNSDSRDMPQMYQDSGNHSRTVDKGAADANAPSIKEPADKDPPQLPHILPGMYAYAKVIIKRHDVPALPLTVTFAEGNQTYCWTHEKGHAVRLEIRTAIRDDEWVEVTNFRKTSEEDWHPFEGHEQVLVAEDLRILSEGTPVEIAKSHEHHDTGR